MRWKKWLKNLSVTAGSVLFSLALAEIVLHLFGLGLPRSGAWEPARPMVVDPTWGTILKGGYSGTVTADDFRFVVRTNSEGFRERELPRAPEDAVDVLFLGDSFFFGYGVDQEKRFSESAAALLGDRDLRHVRLWNLSQAGASTADEVRILRAARGRFLAPHVMVGFFVGNDFKDNLLSLQLERARRGEEAGTRGRQRRRLRGLLRRSRVVSLVSDGLWTQSWFRRLFNRMEIRNDRIAIYQSWTDPEAEPLFTATREALAELAAFCREEGLPLTVVLIPDHLQVLYPKIFEDYDLLRPQRWLEQVLSEENVPVIDLYEVFAAQADPAALMFRRDKHWNEEGHALVAGVLAEHLAGALATRGDGEAGNAVSRRAAADRHLPAEAAWTGD